MKNKINIAELLKDCPKGMELDCSMYENLYFDYISNSKIYPICCYTEDNLKAKHPIIFTWYGRPSQHDSAKCVIFPKGKTTWEGFQRPFKDGDILSYQCGCFKNRSIYIYKYHNTMNTSYYVALSGSNDQEFRINYTGNCALNGHNDTVRHATEEEKQKLFDAIKANGYKWNPETKTLKKLPKFKVGDIIQDKNDYRVRITDVGIEDECYGYESLTINGIGGISFNRQDDWELVPNKFDINTLEPFNKVLVRQNDSGKWSIDFFGGYAEGLYYTTGSSMYIQCIPYEKNEHLLGTNNDCDDFYKTWE